MIYKMQMTLNKEFMSWSLRVKYCNSICQIKILSRSITLKLLSLNWHLISKIINRLSKQHFKNGRKRNKSKKNIIRIMYKRSALTYSLIKRTLFTINLGMSSSNILT